MRFLPGEPNTGQNCVTFQFWDGNHFLIYCSGNNLVILRDGGTELLQTVYLPSDGIAVKMNSETGVIAVAYCNKVDVYKPLVSFHRPLKFELSESLEATGVAAVDWIDVNKLVIAGEYLEVRDLKTNEKQRKFCGNVSQITYSQGYCACFTHTRILQLWNLESLEFDCLKHSANLKWAEWHSRHPVLLTYCEDQVLRGFRRLKNGRFGLSLAVRVGECPCIYFEGEQTIVYSLDKKKKYHLYFDELVTTKITDWEFTLPSRIHLKNTLLRSYCYKGSPLFLGRTYMGALAVLIYRDDNIQFHSVLNGHSKSIRKIGRDPFGKTLFTQSKFSDNAVWREFHEQAGTTLIQQSAVEDIGQVLHAMLRGKYLATVNKDLVQIWDTTESRAKMLAKTEVDGNAVLCVFMTLHDEAVIVGVMFANAAQMWNFSRGTLEPKHRIEHPPIVSAAVNDYGVATVNESNLIQTWVYEDSQLRELLKFQCSTRVSKVQMSSTQKLAIALDNRVLIWDAQSDVIEFDKTVDTSVKDLDWTTTPSGECLLGVGYAHSVVVYAQQRYYYAKNLEAWVPIRAMDISSKTTHEIGDSIWLGDGTFVIGAGNQLFIQDARVDLNDEAMRDLLNSRGLMNTLEEATTIFDIATILNGPLPVYHPQLVIQLIYSGRLDLVGRILGQLLHELKFAVVGDDNRAHLDSWLGFQPLEFEEVPSEISVMIEFTPGQAEQLEEQLQKKSLSYLSRHQQLSLLTIVEGVKSLSANAGVDLPACKYLLGFQLFRLHPEQSTMNMRDYAWASLSNSKQLLLDEVERAGISSWERFSCYGLTYWLERPALISKVEQLASRVFQGSRDPTKVSLYYLALRKKSLLLGLWRVSSSHPEQAKTLKLLSHDFETPRWKEAALKNAYALMSKHRYEYAAALFLLGDAVKDACNVLWRQLRDPSLAILVARVYDGDDGEAMKYLVENFIQDQDSDGVDQDVYSHERWQLAWAYMTMGNYKVSCECVAQAPKGRLQRITDPVLIWFYQDVRSHSRLSSAEETRMLLRTSDIYCRMGCDILALSMVRGWKFAYPRKDTSQHTETLEPAKNGTEPKTIFDTLGSGSDTEPKEPESSNDLKAPPATAFEPEKVDFSAFGF